VSDNFLGLSSIAYIENIWFHIEDPFDNFVILDSELRYLVSDIEETDSLVFNFCKWLHCSYDGGYILVRNINYHKSRFSQHPWYLAKPGRDCTEELGQTIADDY